MDLSSADDVVVVWGRRRFFDGSMFTGIMFSRQFCSFL
jgi:hypothetical protein